MPYIIKLVPGGENNTKHYTAVGDAYVHGIIRVWAFMGVETSGRSGSCFREQIIINDAK